MSTVNETENGYFLAVRPEIDKVPEIVSLHDCTRISDVIVHSFDNSFWEVTTDNEDLIARLSRRFKSATISRTLMQGFSDAIE